MKEINYTFSIGSNCDSTFFIRHNDLCKFAGPLDWVYIDFESALLNMEEGFERFTKDLFYYEPEADYRSMDDDELQEYLINRKDYNQVHPRLVGISENQFELHPSKPYVKEFYINQHFLPDILETNLVKWNRSCWFPHHDFQDEIQVKVLENKLLAFNKLYEDNQDNILFIGFNKFEELEEAYFYMRKCLRDYLKSDLRSDVFYIILAPTHTPPDVIKYEGITFFLHHFEGIYQFHEDTKLPEAHNYLKSLYEFNPKEKPQNLDYHLTTTFSDYYDEMISKTLDTHSWSGA